MTLTWVDWSIVGIVVISSLISLRQGFVKEALSLLTWVVAAIVAWLFSDSLSLFFVDYIDTPSLRKIIAVVSLFVVALISGGIINALIDKLVKFSGLTGTDRFLGMVFGGLRGVLMVVVLVGLASYLPIKQDSWWSDSILLSYFEDMAQWSKSMVFKWIAPIVNDF